MENKEDRYQQGLTAIIIGFFSNTILAVVKTIIGIFGSSPALLADGIMSASDVVYNAVVWVFIRMSGKPADEEHPYGHDQLETIGALMVGAFIITTGISVLWNSINQLIEIFSNSEGFIPSEPAALWVAFGSLLLKIVLAVYTKRIGDRTNNLAVSAVAQDHQVDTYSAAVVIAGILLGRLNLFWAEPLFGGIIGLLILRTGIEILRSSSDDLMDTVPGGKLKKQVPQILSGVKGIEKIDDFRAHRFGPYLVMNITICVDGNLTVNQGHDISVEVEEKLIENINFLREVHVHYHPLDTH